MKRKTKIVGITATAILLLWISILPTFAGTAKGWFYCNTCGSEWQYNLDPCWDCDGGTDITYMCPCGTNTDVMTPGVTKFCSGCGAFMGWEDTESRTYTQAEVDEMLLAESSRSYQEGYDYGYQEGYDDSEVATWDEAYWKGYDQGQKDGAVCTGHVTEEEALEREEAAYKRGIDKGEANDVTGNFRTLLGDIVTAPYRAITTMFDFEVFGVNLAGLVFKIITLLITLLIVEKLLSLIF